MSPAQEQFARIRRYLDRMERKGTTDADYDDMLSFFVHAWHLIEWTKNDPTIGGSVNVWKHATASASIRHCGDIANGTKHVKLTRPYARPTPKVTREDVGIWVGHGAEKSYEFTLSDGSKQDALLLARQIVSDWQALLKRYGVSV